MTAPGLAFLIFRRMIFYVLFVSIGIGFLVYVVNGFVQYSRHLRLERHALELINADVIAPKGSTVEHLRRLLRLELIHDPVLLPAQLYTTLNTDPPPGLKLTPVMFWGISHDLPVIASNANLQEILQHEFPAITDLGSREVIVGMTAAQTLHAKAGDSIDITTEFGNLVLRPYSDKFVVKAVADLGPWNGAILSSYDQIQSVLTKLDFIPEQIWKTTILSYIFVTGPEEYLQQTRQLIDKRTVAVDLRLKNEVPNLMRLSGIDENLELEVLVFALISSLISLFAFLAIWIPALGAMTKKLRRSGYSRQKLTASFAILMLMLFAIAAALSSAATYLHPIL